MDLLIKDKLLECGVRGSVTIYDMAQDKWFFSDENDALSYSLPASTFKIVNSLIALDKKATSLEEVFFWDGVSHEVDSWNSDTNLENAFKNSVLWVYERLAKRIKPDTYLSYLKNIEYGNGNIFKENQYDFWVNGSFAVTPVQQVNMLKKLYKDELPFSKEVMHTVKEFMNCGDKLQVWGKTGWARHDNHHTGWWVGYTKEKNNILFFATRVSKSGNDNLDLFSSCRKDITNYAIRQLREIQS